MEEIDIESVIKNSGILEMKNGTLMPFSKKDSNESLFMLMDSHENCKKIGINPVAYFSVIKKRLDNNGSFESWFLILKLSSVIYKTYFLTLLPDQRKEFENFINADKFVIYIIEKIDSGNKIQVVKNIFPKNKEITLINNNGSILCNSEKEITKEDLQYLERIIALPGEEFCEAVGVIMV